MNEETRYLLVETTNDIDEDEGQTKREILAMLAEELGYGLRMDF